MKKSILIPLSILLLGTIFIYFFKDFEEQDFQVSYAPEESLIKTVSPSKKKEPAQNTESPKILDTSITTYQNYTDKETGISFKYPSHYIFKQGGEGYSLVSGTSSSIIFLNPNGPTEMYPGINLGISAAGDLEKQNSTKLKEEVIEKYEEAVQDSLRQGQIEQRDALLSITTKNIQNETWIELIKKAYYVDVYYGNQSYYFIQKEDTLYEISFFGLEEKVILEILSSVKFI